MKKSRVIIVGGGPAGSAAARVLSQNGMESLILDKAAFPRPKLCAGWITPKVLAVLGITPDQYPHAIRQFDRIVFHLRGLKIPVRTRQYAIRRYEFDHWMAERTGVPLEQHRVKQIFRDGNTFIIDNQYQCKYLIGAGGTHCPVRKSLFGKRRSRPDRALIVAVEKEYLHAQQSNDCHLWFLDDGLPGYAWYVPKKNGWINIGIGGKMMKLKERDKTIMDHWHGFVRRLKANGFIGAIPRHPSGHTYYLKSGSRSCRLDNAFLVGDAAGLSTLDMGEGICAAIESGISAAGAILNHHPFNPGLSARFSLPGILLSSFSSLRPSDPDP